MARSAFIPTRKPPNPLNIALHSMREISRHRAVLDHTVRRVGIDRLGTVAASDVIQGKAGIRRQGEGCCQAFRHCRAGWADGAAALGIDGVLVNDGIVEVGYVGVLSGRVDGNGMSRTGARRDRLGAQGG